MCIADDGDGLDIETDESGCEKEDVDGTETDDVEGEFDDEEAVDELSLASDLISGEVADFGDEYVQYSPGTLLRDFGPAKKGETYSSIIIQLQGTPLIEFIKGEDDESATYKVRFTLTPVVDE